MSTQGPAERLTPQHWFPPASHLIEYSSISVDAPDQLLQLVLDETSFQREQMEHAMKREAAERLRGQLFGLIIGLAGIGAATTIALALGDWPGAIGGSALGGTTIMGLVSIFVLERRAPHTTPPESDESSLSSTAETRSNP